jgi:hypothetical protein
MNRILIFVAAIAASIAGASCIDGTTVYNVPDPGSDPGTMDTSDGAPADDADPESAAPASDAGADDAASESAAPASDAGADADDAGDAPSGD